MSLKALWGVRPVTIAPRNQQCLAAGIGVFSRLPYPPYFEVFEHLFFL